MERNLKNLIIFQTIGMVSLVLLVSSSLALIFSLSHLQIANNMKRPGINIKEF